MNMFLTLSYLIGDIERMVNSFKWGHSGSTNKVFFGSYGINCLCTKMEACVSKLLQLLILLRLINKVGGLWRIRMPLLVAFWRLDIFPEVVILIRILDTLQALSGEASEMLNVLSVIPKPVNSDTTLNQIIVANILLPGSKTWNVNMINLI